MRIISGKFRGKIIEAPTTLPVRPTTDFAKTGLFNMLDSRYTISKLAVLDLYSGTGSLSYEFFSRGATSVTSVDKDSGCIKFIRKIIEVLQAGKNIQPVTDDALHFLKMTNSVYDIIVADPPFEITPAAELVALIFERKLLKKEGVFILEHESKKKLDALPYFREKRKYGNITFSFFDEASAAAKDSSIIS